MKKIRLACLTVIGLVLHFAPASAKNCNSRLTTTVTQLTPSDTLLRPCAAAPNTIDSLINYARTCLGVRYRSGGRSRNGFDCSGFTSYVFSQFGIMLPHSSASQAQARKKLPQDAIQKGDLIFFKGSNANSKRVGHVGIVVSEAGEKVQFIHASSYRGISIDTIDSAYYRKRYLGIRRLPIP